MCVKGVRGPSVLHRPRKTERARFTLETVIQCPGSLDGHRVFLSQEFGQRKVVIERRGRIELEGAVSNLDVLTVLKALEGTRKLART